MDPNYLNNFEWGPTKDHACEIWSKSKQWFRRRCYLKKLFTDAQTDRRLTKCNHKSSPCHYVTGEVIKKNIYGVKSMSDALAADQQYFLWNPVVSGIVCSECCKGTLFLINGEVAFWGKFVLDKKNNETQDGVEVICSTITYYPIEHSDTIPSNIVYQQPVVWCRTQNFNLIFLTSNNFIYFIPLSIILFSPTCYLSLSFITCNQLHIIRCE